MPFLKALIGMAAAAASLAGADLSIGATPLVAHEWGTFTSVTQEDGTAVEWAPLLGPGDLPCFVIRPGAVYKSVARGLVRMETPVLYFYSQRAQTISVHVDFPQGLITEWYPNSPSRISQANIPNAMEWKQVQLAPGQDLAYPMTKGESRYYAARNTDSTPLRIGDQQEKMIFYRGLGNFAPPVRARYESDGKLELRNTGTETIPLAILFENQGGAIGFRIVEDVAGSVRMEAPELTRDLAAIRELLAARLTRLGLYPKEARAMVDTWGDSWFTEGSRVFYIVPRATVDALLPLKILPAPADIQRVFVGRLEVLSPRTEDTLRHAIRAGNNETLTAFRRFLEPFVGQMQRTEKDFVLTPAVKAYLGAIAGGHSFAGDGYGGASEPASCVE
jgi:hypothetical protein